MKNKFKIIILALGILFLMIGCSQQKKATPKPTTKLTYANFQKIQLGKNGSTIKSLQKHFGKPTKVVKVGETPLTYMWNYQNKKDKKPYIIVYLNDGYIYHKVFDAAKPERQHKITLADYNKVKKSKPTSAHDIIKVLGDPDMISESTNDIILNYTSGLNSAKKNNIVTYLINKTNGQTAMKYDDLK